MLDTLIHEVPNLEELIYEATPEVLVFTPAEEKLVYEVALAILVYAPESEELVYGNEHLD
jgi:hypothetical protein